MITSCTSSRPAKACCQAASRTSTPLRADGAADEEEAQRGRGVERVGRAVGREALEVDPVGDDVDAVRRRGRRAGTCRARSSLGTQTSSTSCGERPDPLGRDGAELPRLDDGQAARARRAQVGRPLVADLDVGGVGQRRVEAARPRGPGAGRASRRAVTSLLMRERLVCSPWSPCQVTAGAAVDSGAREGRSPRVVGLELVDVRGERRAAPRSRPAAARAGPARAARRSSWRGEVAGVAGRRRAGRRRRRARPRPGRRGAGRASGTRPARHSAAISGAQSHHSEGSTATSTPASSSGSSAGAEGAAQLDHAARVERRAAGGRSARRHLAVDEHAQLAARCAGPPRSAAAGPCAGRRSRRRRRSGARRRDRARRSRPSRSQISSAAGIGLADDVDHLGRVVLAGEGAAHRVGDGEAHRRRRA